VAITFDPSAKRIILDSTAVTASQLWSRWSDWAAAADNAKYLPAFRQAGGDDLGGGLSIPAYIFLLNGWRVRPMEANHALIITGNLFVDGGGVPVVNTLGAFNVSTQYTVPVQAQAVSTGGSGSGAADTWAFPVEGSLTAAELLRLMAAVLAGKTTITDLGNGTGSVKFKAVNGTADRVEATMTGSTRTNVTLTP
jgi:hypothetical protein